MNWKHLSTGLLLVLVIALGVGGAYYAGIGPAPGGEAGDPITDFPTATPSDESSGDGAGSTGTMEPPPFSFTIETIDECGMTCRDVTVTLHNNQADPATGVTVFTRIFAGQDNTDTADLVWEGTEEVGTLEAGASHTTTRRVELSLQEARKIDNNGGWVTIVTTVQTDERTVTFTSSEQVT